MSHHHFGMVVAGGFWLDWSLVLLEAHPHTCSGAEADHEELECRGCPARKGHSWVVIVGIADVVPSLAEEEARRTDWVVVGQCFCAFDPACFDPPL